jgi:hypothetical protein
VVFIFFQLGKEKPGSWSSCDETLSFKFWTEASEVFGGMVMADMAEISRAMDLAMPISSAIMAHHGRVINSIAVMESLLRRSTVIGGGRCL